MPHESVETALRAVESWAALVRYAANIASIGHEPPDPAALVGIGEACENIEQLTRTVRRSLPVDALEVTLRVNHADGRPMSRHRPAVRNRQRPLTKARRPRV